MFSTATRQILRRFAFILATTIFIIVSLSGIYAGTAPSVPQTLPTRPPFSQSVIPLAISSDSVVIHQKKSQPVPVISAKKTKKEITQKKEKKNRKSPLKIKDDDTTLGIVLLCIAFVLIGLTVMYGLGAGGMFIPRVFFYIGAVLMTGIMAVVAVFSFQYYYGWGSLLLISVGLWSFALGGLIEPWILIAAAVIFGILAVISLIFGIIKAAG